MDNEFDAKTIRDDRAKRAARMTEPGDPRKKVDASSWTPPESMQTGKQVQPKRPADPLFRAAGGKTVARADRKPRCGGGMMRASGGKAEAEFARDTQNRPMAEKGLTSYRAKLPSSANHIMIGAKNHEDALREARRSNGSVKPEHLEVWDGGSYKPVARANGGATNPVPVSRMSFGQRSSTPLPGTTSAMKKGGAANSDEKQDRALVKKMVKPEARTGKANGGHPKGCSCASCSGGRVERASGGRTYSDVLSGKTRYKSTDAEKAGPVEKVGKTGVIPKSVLTHPSHNLGSLMDKFGEDRVKESMDHHGFDTSRMFRASGGRAKGKTNIVIHVNPGNTTPPQPAAAPQAMQPHPAMPLPTAPPPMAPPQGLMPAGGPPPGAMPPVGMPRKRGGRADGGAADYDAQGLGVPMAEDRNPAPGDVYSRGSDGVMQKTKIQPAYRKAREAEDPALTRKRGGRAYYDLEGGAGSGLGRLEKANRA